jgi:amino acid transporter
MVKNNSPYFTVFILSFIISTTFGVLVYFGYLEYFLIYSLITISFMFLRISPFSPEDKELRQQVTIFIFITNIIPWIMFLFVFE